MRRILILLALATSTFAATNVWRGVTNNAAWSTDANWSLGVKPTADDVVWFGTNANPAGAVGSNTSCIVDDAANAMQVVVSNGYTKTLTINALLTVSNLFTSVGGNWTCSNNLGITFLASSNNFLGVVNTFLTWVDNGTNTFRGSGSLSAATHNACYLSNANVQTSGGSFRKILLNAATINGGVLNLIPTDSQPIVVKGGWSSITVGPTITPTTNTSWIILPTSGVTVGNASTSLCGSRDTTMLNYIFDGPVVTNWVNQVGSAIIDAGIQSGANSNSATLWLTNVTLLVCSRFRVGSGMLAPNTAYCYATNGTVININGGVTSLILFQARSYTDLTGSTLTVSNASAFGVTVTAGATIITTGSTLSFANSSVGAITSAGVGWNYVELTSANKAVDLVDAFRCNTLRIAPTSGAGTFNFNGFTATIGTLTNVTNGRLNASNSTIIVTNLVQTGGTFSNMTSTIQLAGNSNVTNLFNLVVGSASASLTGALVNITGTLTGAIGTALNGNNGTLNLSNPGYIAGGFSNGVATNKALTVGRSQNAGGKLNDISRRGAE